MGPGQGERLIAGLLVKFEKGARQSLADASEGHTFNHRNERTQTAAEDRESLQGNLGMLKADRPEVSLVNKEYNHRIDSLHGCRIRASIEQRHFRNGCWRGLHSERHLPSRWRGLEDLH